MSNVTLHFLSKRLDEQRTRTNALELTVKNLQAYIADRFRIDTAKLLARRIDRIESHFERRVDFLVVDNGEQHSKFKTEIDDLKAKLTTFAQAEEHPFGANPPPDS